MMPDRDPCRDICDAGSVHQVEPKSKRYCDNAHYRIARARDVGHFVSQGRQMTNGPAWLE